MTVIVPLIAIGVMLSIMLVLYAIARADALKFFVLIPGALVLALILNWVGLSDEMAYIGVGLTLSMVYYMR